MQHKPIKICECKNKIYLNRNSKNIYILLIINANTIFKKTQ